MKMIGMYLDNYVIYSKVYLLIKQHNNFLFGTIYFTEDLSVAYLKSDFTDS
ncbi:hypothetical protein [Ekhidna sp.]